MIHDESSEGFGGTVWGKHPIQIFGGLVIGDMKYHSHLSNEKDGPNGCLFRVYVGDYNYYPVRMEIVSLSPP